ncbi:hypothetical protein E2C01_089542 [Portunus trituberculatus]|uniref:Uncharacterized protein n=1 Tax=Portunus trituberculatus TaxID=210409 RepID=A0A5B7JII0_PORTR|nr:hypothetical protein [Portunus trituberculatus]
MIVSDYRRDDDDMIVVVVVKDVMFPDTMAIYLPFQSSLGKHPPVSTYHPICPLLTPHLFFR